MNSFQAPQRIIFSCKAILFFLLLFISISVLASEERVDIEHLRVSKDVGHWRLVFDATGPITYHLFQLAHPYRVVFDINNVGKDIPFSSFQFFGTPIDTIRSAMHADHRLRIVLVTADPLHVNSFVLPPNKDKARDYRLVINLASNKAMLPVPAGNNSMPANSVDAQNSKDKKSGKDIIIVVDPGHGGKDPGTTGPGGHHEKTVVLAIAKDLVHDLNQQPGFKAMLTRTGDYYITLRQRLAIARKDHADMFVAIHADAWKNVNATGASVFALSERGATSEAARWLAARENASELMGGVNLADKTHLLKSVLINLSQTATIQSSLKIGTDIIHFLGQVTPMHHSVVEQAAFVVLKSPDIPSLLIETGFMSNINEEHKLINPVYQHHLAKAIMEGVIDYFNHRPPRGSWLAMQRGK